MGALLMQEHIPVAFFSRILGPRAQAKLVYKKELIAVCLVVQKWKHYLLGRHFIIRTNQQSVRFIMQQQEVGTEYQESVSKLIGSDFELQYKHDASNFAANALSCNDHGCVELGAVVCTQVVNWATLHQEIKSDAVLQTHDL